MRGNLFSFVSLLAAFLCISCKGDISVEPQGKSSVIKVDAPSWDGEKRADITYQLLVYSFADSDGDGCGDFNGIVSKLDYLDELGISALWLSPIHPSASYHGYDVKDYSSVNPQFGTMEDFRNLVAEAHRHGIKIYLDYVLNHSSTENEWFLKAKESEDSPYRDFYIFSENPQEDIKSGAIPMISTQGASGYVAGEWFWSGTDFFHSHFQTDWFADLNYGPVEAAENSPAFKAMVEAAKIWIDAGIDGFRLDAVKHIYHNAASNENPVFLKKFYDAVNGYFHQSHTENFYMVGENFSEAAVVAPYYAGLPAMFDFSFWWRTSEALNNGKGSDFASKIVSNRDYCRAVNPDFIDATKLSNHDEDRALTTLGGDSKKAKMAASFLMTSAGSPYIYYGEELGVSGSKANGDENVRKNVNWKNAENQKQDAGSFLTHYLTQTALRNTFKALAKGEMRAFDGIVPQSIAAWYMEGNGQRLLVVHNVGNSLASFSVDVDLSSPVFVDGYVATKKIDNGYSLIMDGMTSVIFEIK